MRRAQPAEREAQKFLGRRLAGAAGDGDDLGGRAGAGGDGEVFEAAPSTFSAAAIEVGLAL